MTTPFAAQREAKITHVREVLGTDLPITFTDTPELPPRHERVRLLWPVQPAPAGLTMGLYRRGTHDVIEPRSCELQEPRLTALAATQRELFCELGVTPYDESTHDGDLRAYSARFVPSTGELLQGLVTRTESLPEGLAAALHERAQSIDGFTPVGVVHNVNPDRGNALLGRSSHAVLGRDHVFDTVDGLVFRISFDSFYQLHRRADALLYRPALDMLGDVTGKRVVDGFGGVGTFGLRLAARGAAVTLIESAPSSCADAKHNANANNLDLQVLTTRFEAAEVEQHPDLLVVDPTRAGLRPSGCARVMALTPDEILYVACGLPALARDLRELSGFRLEEVRLVDLFPHTDHVEILARLRRA